MTYLLLFYEFFKTGLFAVGGGMATLPLPVTVKVRLSTLPSSEVLTILAEP